ncbi:hypothetical protein FJ251_14975 [bacterium]|nr:hypothetical protein [bacterium]
MSRLLAALWLGAWATALVAGTGAAGVMTRAGVKPAPPPDNAPPVAPALPHEVAFNTGGAMFTPPAYGGTASGWGYYILHEYCFPYGMLVGRFGFPTNEYSGDPIAMPVEWVIDCEVGDIYAIVNPYIHDWTWRGTFYPAGDPDTSPPDTYTVVNVSGLCIFVQAGETMVWGYENAGLCGTIVYNGVETICWYVSYWDSDAPYGYTSLMQFEAWDCTPTAERSLSAIKSLY